MIKIKAGILSKDSLYVERLIRVLEIEYHEEIQIIELENINEIYQKIKNKKISLLILDENIHIDYEDISRQCAIVVLSETRKYDRSKEYGILYKYQHIDEIYSCIEQIYKEHHGCAKVVAFTNAGGNSGSSIMALACAEFLAKQNKKILYINGETVSFDDCYFIDAKNLGIKLATDENLQNLYDDRCYCRFEKIADEIRYDYIVLDIQNSMLQYKNFLEKIFALIIVEIPEENSIVKAEKILKLTNSVENVFVLRNKIKKDNFNRTDKCFGNIPFFQEYEYWQLIEHISDIGIFEQLI